ncbi:hypothetical protein DL96DRAFT_1712950 [Flagelloscypha sp. PMI_526]|nr:hypothetical protein DL96DRAFT_1712950 [Flagelloscypha sp. PMI_526]
MAAPPGYAQATDRPSLAYAPTKYSIGGKTLRRRVEALELDQDLASQLFYLPKGNERKWSWFVGLAVERFPIWCESLQENDLDNHGLNVLPPPDVLMVFQTYLLNPGWFREDTHRITLCKHLPAIADFIAKSLSRMDEFVESSAPIERVELWAERCNIPFDPFSSAVVLASKPLYCPHCSTRIAVPYADATGTGYLQHRFSVSCPSCSMVIDKDVLGMVKLAHDLARLTSDPEQTLAGALWTPEKDLLDAPRTSSVRLGIDRRVRMNSAQDILTQVKFKPDNMRQLVHDGFEYPKLWNRIKSAYANGSPFSVDLVGAVFPSLYSHIFPASPLVGPTPGAFNGDEERVLVHCIARYHAFLDILSTDPHGMAVPTLDIDLAWHTHQLMPTKYRLNMELLLNRSLDHDDTVLESTLETAFDSTSRVWQKRFGTRYTHCGCPVPGDTIGAKLGKLLGSPNTSTPPFLAPEGRRDDMAALTHPSDHNAVYMLSHKKHCDVLRAERATKHKKRKEHEVRAFMKKKDSNGKDLDEEAIKRRLKDGHDPAFLIPIPMEEYEDPQADCAPFGGQVVYSETG